MQKFLYSGKARKIWKESSNFFDVAKYLIVMGRFFSNFVAFSEYINFIQILWLFAFFLNMVIYITALCSFG